MTPTPGRGAPTPRAGRKSAIRTRHYFNEHPISAVDNYRLRLERAGLGEAGIAPLDQSELVLDDVGLGFLDAVAQPFGHGGDRDAQLGRAEQQLPDALDRVAVRRLGADHQEQAVRGEVPAQGVQRTDVMRYPPRATPAPRDALPLGYKPGQARYRRTMAKTSSERPSALMTSAASTTSKRPRSKPASWLG